MSSDKFMGFMPPLDAWNRWRILVGGVSFLSCVFMLYALGAFVHLGLDGFARAADVQKQVEAGVADVKKDVEAVKQQTTNIETKVDATAAALDVVLAEYYAKKIREQVRLRCKTPIEDTVTRERINEQIRQDKIAYFNHAKTVFEMPSCADV